MIAKRSFKKLALRFCRMRKSISSHGWLVICCHLFARAPFTSKLTRVVVHNRLLLGRSGQHVVGNWLVDVGPHLHLDLFEFNCAGLILWLLNLNMVKTDQESNSNVKSNLNEFYTKKEDEDFKYPIRATWLWHVYSNNLDCFALWTIQRSLVLLPQSLFSTKNQILRPRGAKFWLDFWWKCKTAYND